MSAIYEIPNPDLSLRKRTKLRDYAVLQLVDYMAELEAYIDAHGFNYKGAYPSELGDPIEWLMAKFARNETLIDEEKIYLNCLAYSVRVREVPHKLKIAPRSEVDALFAAEWPLYHIPDEEGGFAADPQELHEPARVYVVEVTRGREDMVFMHTLNRELAITCARQLEKEIDISYDEIIVSSYILEREICDMDTQYREKAQGRRKEWR